MNSSCAASPLLGSREAVTGQAPTGTKARSLPGLPKLCPTPEAPTQAPQSCTPWVTSRLGWPGAGPQSPWCKDWWFVSSLSAEKTPACPAVVPWVPGAAPRSLCPFPTASLIWAPTDLRTVLRAAPLLLRKASWRMGYPRHEFTDHLQCKQSDKKKSHKTKIGNNIQMWPFRRSISGYCPPTQVTQLKLQQIKTPNLTSFHMQVSWGLIQCSAESRERLLFASLGHSKYASAWTWSLIYAFSHLTWYFAMKTFNYTCLKSPRFDSNWCFFLVLTETDSIWVVIISRRSTQTGKRFRFDVTTARCHLGICCCQLFPPQTLCQSAYIFAGELSSSLCELKSTSHTGMHTLCFKYHKQMIPQAFSKHLRDLSSSTG